MGGPLAEKQPSNSTPERRSHPRHAEPTLAVSVAGRVFDTENWSMSGMVLADYDGPLSVGSIFDVSTLSRATEKEKPSAVQISARVIRKKGTVLAFNFLEVDQAAFLLLQEWMAERMKILNEEATNY